MDIGLNIDGAAVDDPALLRQLLANAIDDLAGTSI
jgi:hypothetical protein